MSDTSTSNWLSFPHFEDAIRHLKDLYHQTLDHLGIKWEDGAPKVFRGQAENGVTDEGSTFAIEASYQHSGMFETFFFRVLEIVPDAVIEAYLHREDKAAVVFRFKSPEDKQSFLDTQLDKHESIRELWHYLRSVAQPSSPQEEN